jgi:hypothetical protein
VAHLELAGSAVKAKRQTEHGYDLIEAPLPAVLSVSDAINTPRLPSIKAIMGAKKKPLDRLSAADAGIDPGSVGSAGARSVVRSLAPPEAKAAGVTIEDSGGDSAAKVVGILAEKGWCRDAAAGSRASTTGSSATALASGGRRWPRRRDGGVRRGSDVDDRAGGLGGHGASKVLVADDPTRPAGCRSRSSTRWRGRPGDADGILFGAGVVSGDVAAELAARIGAGIACETTAISGRRLPGPVRPALETA